MDRFQPALGQRVKARRKQLGMTQGELAGRELTKSTISQIECGKLVPSLKTLGTIADRLGLPISSLIDEERTLPPPTPIASMAHELGIDEDLLRNTLRRFFLDSGIPN